MSVDFAMNAMIHRALFRELERIEALLDSEDVAAARKHWWFFSDILHQHHEGEDTFLMPLITARSTDPKELATVDALIAEHQQMHAALDACDADFRSEPDLPTTTGDDLRALQVVLAAHCAHEEAEGDPLLTRYVTEDDMKPFNAANRSAKHSMLVFPWIADGGSAQDQRVYDVLPGPVRLVMKPLMTRKYRAYFRD
ncbi:MAG: hemerythrin domain-containing protein [Candidatus Nanopelagicales bacterium]|jgi:hypothetical protein|nr:hemerythrin domain-containing protein [Candidatus Nanopelagicales bacterium]